MDAVGTKRIVSVGLGLGSVFAVLVVLALSPVPPPTAENTTPVEGRVAEVTSPCCGDVEIRLEGDERLFYVSRGVERGLDAGRLNDRLAGRVVVLHTVARRWSPLDPFHRAAPVARIAVGGEVVFSTDG